SKQNPCAPCWRTTPAMFQLNARIPSIHSGLPAGPFLFTACVSCFEQVCFNLSSSVAYMLLRAFAKINLDLRILGKRPDGYHEIRTIYQTIDWYDEILLEPSPVFEFSATDGPQDETNLVVRAVRLFESATQQKANVRVRL